MVDPLAAAYALQNAAHFIEAIRRHENRDRLADDLLRRVAEDPLRAGVPGGDDAVQIFADDRVVGRFDYGGELRCSLLGLLALADVARERQVERLAALAERAGADLDGERGAVLAPMARLERDDFPGVGALREPTDGRFVQPRIELAWVHADQLFAAPAHALAGLSVDIHDPQVLVQQ